MVRFRNLGLILVLVASAPLMACSQDDTGGNGGPDATRPDASGQDAADVPSDVAPDMPTTGESLAIAFVTHTRVGIEPEAWQMLVGDEDCDTWPDRCDTVEVSGGGFTCQSECAISPNRDYALWMDPNTSGTLMIGDLDANSTVTGNVRTLAQGVETWQMGPEKVVFSRTGIVFAQAYSGGDATQIVSINPNTLPGGVYYAPHIDAVIVNIPTSLSAMDLREVSVSDPTNNRLLYHFVSDVEQTTGSFYQGQLDISVSPDGQVVALITRALDNTDTCTDTATCHEEYVCSPDAHRCIGEQLLLHVINRSEAGQLSVPNAEHRCSSDAECGQYHMCDMTAPDEANLGACIPGKRVLGPQGRFSCMTDRSGGPYLDAGEYNDVVGPPLWRSDGRMMLVVKNDCVTNDIPITNLVAIDRNLGDMQLVIENPGQPHGGPDCYDDVEYEWTPEGCYVEISEARMSPSGNTVVFIADSVRSYTDTEAWIIDAFGRGGKRDLTRDINTEILDIQVFDR